MKLFGRPPLKAEFRAPSHLYRFANLETECRAVHLTYSSSDAERAARHAKDVEEVVEAIWSEGFEAGVANAVETASVKYMIVTQEQLDEINAKGVLKS